MEESVRAETVFLDYLSRGHGSYGNAPRTPNRSSGNMDFGDVFGGPPRRFSMQEGRERFSFSESGGLEHGGASPMSAATRRRCLNDGFFDDIFRGDESGNSPRRTNHDQDNIYGSNHSSRITSPMPKSENSIPLPTQFSLSANLTKATEYSTFVPQNHSHFRMDGLTNRVASPRSSSSSSRLYHRSPLASFSSEDSSSTGTSDPKDSVNKMEKDSRNIEYPMNGNMFHFSIHKWAGTAIPVFTPPIGNHMSRSSRSVNSNGKKSWIKMNQVFSVDREAESLKQEGENQDFVSYKEGKESKHSSEEAANDILRRKLQTRTEDTVISGMGSQDEVEQAKKVQNNLHVKSDLKPLREFFADVKQSELKESESINQIVDDSNKNKGNGAKKEETRTDSNRKEVDKFGPKGGSVITLNESGTGEVKGKVKERIQIFNHESESRPRANFQKHGQNVMVKVVCNDEKEKEVKNQAKLNNADTKSDASLKVNENPNKDESLRKSETTYPSSQKLFQANSKISIENDAFEDSFLVQELTCDPEKDVESDKVAEDIDAKILQWSAGKQGNIRSLLSTLHMVLWPGNGWKSVPLVDLIEANAVKRAYQKALLRLHPDKLQQNGAASDEKYIAEKVFDILQDAWDQFNAFGTL